MNRQDTEKRLLQKLRDRDSLLQEKREWLRDWRTVYKECEDQIRQLRTALEKEVDRGGPVA